LIDVQLQARLGSVLSPIALTDRIVSSVEPRWAHPFE
jgi:hypothetical protein